MTYTPNKFNIRTSDYQKWIVEEVRFIFINALFAIVVDCQSINNINPYHYVSILFYLFSANHISFTIVNFIFFPIFISSNQVPSLVKK